MLNHEQDGADRGDNTTQQGANSQEQRNLDVEEEDLALQIDKIIIKREGELSYI